MFKKFNAAISSKKHTAAKENGHAETPAKTDGEATVMHVRTLMATDKFYEKLAVDIAEEKDLKEIVIEKRLCSLTDLARKQLAKELLAFDENKDKLPVKSTLAISMAKWHGSDTIAHKAEIDSLRSQLAKIPGVKEEVLPGKNNHRFTAKLGAKRFIEVVVLNDWPAADEVEDDEEW